MQPKVIFPTTTELRKNREYWNPKILHFRGRKIVYDQNIRIGECLLCKRNGKAQWKPKTYLHHLFYDDTYPLAYTIEVCGKCHYKIDSHNKRQVNRTYAGRDRSYFRTKADRRFLDAEFKRLGLKRY